MGKSKTDRLLLAGLAVAFLCFSYVIHDLFEQRVVDVGDTAPQFTVTTNNGTRVSRSEFGGKLLVLNFWATWCPPCVQEMPSLNEMAQALRAEGVVVLGVSIDTNEEAFKRFVTQRGLAFPVARDPKADIPSDYGTFKWPETYVIDRTGKVVRKYIGDKVWTDPQVMSELRSFL